MEILGKRAFYRRREEMLRAMARGKVFVYPTDTIYGIGCSALVKSSVRRVRRIKRRKARPFSVIAPSKEWIERNCLVDGSSRRWLAKLPGKITLVLPLRNSRAVSSEVNGGLGSLGVRIPGNWFAAAVGEAGIPFVTTSVNPTNGKPMTSLMDMDKGIMGSVDYIIYQGPLRGRPSRVLSFVSGRKVLR